MWENPTFNIDLDRYEWKNGDNKVTAWVAMQAWLTWDNWAKRLWYRRLHTYE